jgi:hypothetical protein
MRPDTVHALAQWVRHTRGVLTTTEKWLARTPPAAVAGELAAVLAVVRGRVDLDDGRRVMPHEWDGVEDPVLRRVEQWLAETPASARELTDGIDLARRLLTDVLTTLTHDRPVALARPPGLHS